MEYRITLRDGSTISTEKDVRIILEASGCIRGIRTRHVPRQITSQREARMLLSPSEVIVEEFLFLAPHAWSRIDMLEGDEQS